MAVLYGLVCIVLFWAGLAIGRAGRPEPKTLPPIVEIDGVFWTYVKDAGWQECRPVGKETR